MQSFKKIIAFSIKCLLKKVKIQVKQSFQINFSNGRIFNKHGNLLTPLTLLTLPTILKINYRNTKIINNNLVFTKFLL